MISCFATASAPSLGAATPNTAHTALDYLTPSKVIPAQHGRNVLQDVFRGLAERDPIRVHLHAVGPVPLLEMNKSTAEADRWSIRNGYFIQRKSA